MRYYPLREAMHRFFRRMTPGHWLAAGIILVLLIAALAYNLSAPDPNPRNDPGMKDIYMRDVLRVGVRTDVRNFSLLEETGEYRGLESEIANTLARSIFGEDGHVEFVPVDFTTRNIKLRAGEVDCVIALNPQNYSTLFSYSQPYYYDAIAVVVMNGGPTSLAQLRGNRVGVLTRPPTGLVNEGARTMLLSYNSAADAGLQVISYSSAPDMFDELRHGDIQAVAIETSLLTAYFSDTEMAVLPNAIGTLGYSVTMQPGSTALKQIVDESLSEMYANGSLPTLWARFNLKDYRNKK